jgi:hypothetical protein
MRGLVRAVPTQLPIPVNDKQKINNFGWKSLKFGAFYHNKSVQYTINFSFLDFKETLSTGPQTVVLTAYYKHI